MPNDQPGCHGNGADHCCYWSSEPCPFLEENTVPGRRWSCALYRELGSWDTVHSDQRYLDTLQPLWRGQGPLWDWLWQQGVRCGSWGLAEGQGSMASLVKIRGNDEQWKKDFQTLILEQWQRAKNGEFIPMFCCFGNRPEVT